MLQSRSEEVKTIEPAKRKKGLELEDSRQRLSFHAELENDGTLREEAPMTGDDKSF